MKKIRIFATALLLAFTLSSCESFFDVELDDQAKIEDIFRQKTEVQKYLSHLYSYIPQEEEVVGMHGWTVGRSDEALFSWYQWVYYTQFRTGNYSSATTNFNYWPDYYIGINQCSIFLKYIDLDKEDTPTTVAYMKAEARFLRAYYYFLLFRQYGPVFIWGDQIADETIDAKSVDRHTVQENIDFMVGELDAIKNDLPVRTDDIGIDGKQWAGRVTRGAALALKSRILLYAASPLYNGCDLYKGQMQNIRGEFLFPQSKDETKWEAAAQAAWDVIELAETGLYDLYKDTEQTDEFTRYMSSYQGVRLKPWNKETIWGWWSRSGSYSWLGGTGGLLACAMPGMTGASGAVYQGYGGIRNRVIRRPDSPMGTSSPVSTGATASRPITAVSTVIPVIMPAWCPTASGGPTRRRTSSSPATTMTPAPISGLQVKAAVSPASVMYGAVFTKPTNRCARLPTIPR